MQHSYWLEFSSCFVAIFIISAELHAFGAIVYLLLGSGQKQYWSDGWPPRPIQNDSIPVGSSPTIKQCHSIQVEASHAEKVRLIQAQPQLMYSLWS